MIAHLESCIEEYEKRLAEGTIAENRDFVICRLCNFHGRKITAHVKGTHSIAPKEYIDGYGLLICEQSSACYGKSATGRLNWVELAKQKGEDITDKLAKMGENVRAYIASHPEDQERRAKVMTKVNQSDLMRQKASETAKKTSTRPDIIANRSAQLKNWRDKNPDEFYDVCVSKMIGNYHSKPETKMFEFMRSLHDFNFKLNQFLEDSSFSTMTKRRQVDMGDMEKKIFVEYDGELHFSNRFIKQSFKGDTVPERLSKDEELNSFIEKQNWLLIRVSYDQYLTRTKQINKIKFDNSQFKPECLEQITKILIENKPGVYKIGEAYGKHQVSS